MIVTSPGRNDVTLKVKTSEGLVGYGEATLNGRELAAVAALAALDSGVRAGPRPDDVN